ncbi:MAG: tripartite tricarboxylate transporter substrate binding protein [Betaproteobacteria bacterium]|nr:tripartite tricarboxylate transporter substrate binding protein [Betaproteobacteria bacterium]
MSRCITGLFVLAALMLAGASFGQGFPAKPIRLVVPFTTVGLPDVLARPVAAKISESIGQPVIVENIAGAGGVIAAQMVAKAPPDGYTVMLTTEAIYAITPALYSKITYDPLRDFTPVIQALRGTLFLVANSSLGVDSVQQLIALAKARPGINYGSPGNGLVHHLAMAQFALMAGVKLTHVPYKGIAQATPALLSGEVSVMFVTLPSVLQHAKSGRLRILAAGSAQRSTFMPDLATVAASGFPGFDIGFNMGFVVPAATPRAITERLNVEFVKALKLPDIQSGLAAFGVEVVAGTPEQFGEQIRKDHDYYTRLVPQIGLKVD